MAASAKRICWDACTWIAYVQKEVIYKDEKPFEDRYALCHPVISSAEKGDIEIVTSGLCLVEVCKSSRVRNEKEDLIAAYFENDYILLVAVDKVVGTTARQLMQQKFPGLKPADATHLATALFAEADELHTFDGDLLALDGKVQNRDGTTFLQIGKPSLGGPPLPLMAAAAEAEMKSEGKADVVEQGPKGEAEAETPGAAPIEGSEGPIGTVPASGAGT